MLENASLARCVLGGVYEELLGQRQKLIEFESGPAVISGDYPANAPNRVHLSGPVTNSNVSPLACR